LRPLAIKQLFTLLLCLAPAAFSKLPALLPTYADIDYAPADPETGRGHKLDLYVPANAAKPMPVVIWTAGSAWLGDTGENLAGIVAAQLGTTGVSSAVQAAVAFYPPTNFVTMDWWALRKCAPIAEKQVLGGGGWCHASADSLLLGCAIQTCPEKVKAASPLTYVTAADSGVVVARLVSKNTLFAWFSPGRVVVIFRPLPRMSPRVEKATTEHPAIA
jgi:hypothetical protein